MTAFFVYAVILKPPSHQYFDVAPYIYGGVAILP